MAKLSDITIKTSEYRPCMVDGKKALFHRWVHNSKVIDASPLVGGHPGGTIAWDSGIVEFEDGTVKCVLPSDIQFLDSDGQFREYDFIRKEIVRLQKETEDLERQIHMTKVLGQAINGTRKEGETK